MLLRSTAGQQQPFIISRMEGSAPPVVQVGSGALGHPFHLAGQSDPALTTVVPAVTTQLLLSIDCRLPGNRGLSEPHHRVPGRSQARIPAVELGGNSELGTSRPD